MKKYAFIKQLNKNDCGAACLSMIVKELTNVDISISDAEKLVIMTENGSSFSNMIRALKKLGIDSNGYKLNIQELNLNELKLPIITQVSEKDSFHYIVIYKICKNKIFIADPLKNSCRWISLKKFFKKWVPFIIEVNSITYSEYLEEFRNSAKISVYKEILKNKKMITMMIINWIISLSIYIISIALVSMYSVYFDIIISNKLTSLIITFSVFYFVLTVISFGISMLNTILHIKINNSVDKKLMKILLNSFFKKNYNVINHYDSGELITRFRGVIQIRNRLLYFVQILPIDIFIFLFTLNILYRQNIKLLIIAILPCLLFITLFLCAHSLLKNASIDYFQNDEKFNTELIQTIKNINALKTYDVLSKAENIVIKKLDALLKSMARFIVLSSIQNNVKNVIFNMFSISIFSVGAYLVINNSFSEGNLLIFNAIALKILNPFSRLLDSQATIEQGKISELKYNDILNTKIPQKKYGNGCCEKISIIELENVFFKYENNEYILNDITLSFEENKNYAIVGNNGSGKTTLAKLLSNQIEETSGVIKINHIENTYYKKEELYRKILYVSSNVSILNDTIMNNILFYRDIDTGIVREKIKKIGLQTIFHDIEFYENIKLNINNLNISMGQMQILNILRATVEEYDVTIFDEITTNISPVLLPRVREYLLGLKGVKIFITHDIEFANMCDKIIEL